MKLAYLYNGKIVITLSGLNESRWDDMYVYGYIRESSCDQNEDRQLIAMRNARIPRKNIFMDKQSGSDFNRPMYKKMVLSDIVLQVLSFVAENERTNIRNRQQEGIEAAKLKGVHFGRPRKPIPDHFPATYERWKKGEITATTAAIMCGVSRSTFFKWVREHAQKSDQ